MMDSDTSKNKTGSETGDAPFLLNIGLVITYRCPIACPHCILKAGPDRREEMKREDVINWINQAAAYNGRQILSVCFTGGEPFFDVEKLREISAFAASRGMISTVVTNGFWAESRHSAVKILESLPHLKVISVSADQHHLAQMPFARVKNALLAAKDLNLFYTAAVCTENVQDPTYLDICNQLADIIGRERINTVITFPVGRAREMGGAGRYEMTDSPPSGACTVASTATIFPDGRVYACMGPVLDIGESHPLMLGDLKEQSLEEVLDGAELNSILHIIRVWGPARLIDLLKKRGYSGILPNQFVKNSICTLCYTLMSERAVREALVELAQDQTLLETTAYARLFYLNERRMLDLIKK